MSELVGWQLQSKKKITKETREFLERFVVAAELLSRV